MKLLEIQSSVRKENSVSMTLSNEFIHAWQTDRPNIQHKLRDVGINPPSHPTELWTKALIITPSAGNFVVGTPLGKMNFCDTYLLSVLGFIGIDEVKVVSVPDQFMPDEIRQREIASAKAKLMNLARDWY